MKIEICDDTKTVCLLLILALFILGFISIISYGSNRYYELAFKAGLIEVQNTGGSGSHWGKP